MALRYLKVGNVDLDMTKYQRDVVYRYGELFIKVTNDGNIIWQKKANYKYKTAVITLNGTYVFTGDIATRYDPRIICPPPYGAYTRFVKFTPVVSGKLMPQSEYAIASYHAAHLQLNENYLRAKGVL